MNQIDREVENNVANPYMFDGHNGENAWWILYFELNENFTLQDIHFFGIPREWLVNFAGQSGRRFYEIDFIGPLQDRQLVKSILLQNLEYLKNIGRILDYRLRTTFVPSTNRDTTYETYYHTINNPNNRVFCL